MYYLDPAKAGEQTAAVPICGYGVALSQDQMMQASSFVGFDFHGDANDGPADHWFMPPDGYPVLTWQTEITGLAGIPDVSGLSPEQARMVLEFAGLKADDVRYDYARPKDVSSGWPTLADRHQRSGYRDASCRLSAPGSAVEILVSLGQYDFGVNPGDGSEEKPYQIETPGQLDALYGQIRPVGQALPTDRGHRPEPLRLPGLADRQFLGRIRRQRTRHPQPEDRPRLVRRASSRPSGS